MFVKEASVLVGTFLFLQNVNCHSCICKCGPTGVLAEQDSCSKTAPTSPLVVRPKALVKPTVTYPLYESSIKGPCFRRQYIVKPAVVQRPVYLPEETHQETHNGESRYDSGVAASTRLLSESSSLTNNHANYISKGLSHASCGPDCQRIDVSGAYHQGLSGGRVTAPADAVSLAIAYQRSQSDYQNKIAESRLPYGFTKLPIELPCHKQKTHKTVHPEESLYTLNGKIVELKPVSEQAARESLSEEAKEELLDLAISEEARDVHTARRPSLSELGYAPARIVPATFVDIPSVAPQPAAPAEAPSHAAYCNDGFKCGTVEYKDVVKYEPVDKTSPFEDTSCESPEEVVRHIPAPAPSTNYNGDVAGVTHSHSRSHKSSSNSRSSSHKKSIVFEKHSS